MPCGMSEQATGAHNTTGQGPSSWGHDVVVLSGRHAQPSDMASKGLEIRRISKTAEKAKGQGAAQPLCKYSSQQQRTEAIGEASTSRKLQEDWRQGTHEGRARPHWHVCPHK